MNTEFVKNTLDTFEGFIAACGNDVATDSEKEEYTVFSGEITTDKKGNIKTYALVAGNSDSDSGAGDEEVEPKIKRVLVAQFPFRSILHNAIAFFKSTVDLYKSAKEEDAKAAEAEAKAQAEADETENQKIDNQISDLNAQISDLKFRKKPVRRFVKKLSFD